MFNKPIYIIGITLVVVAAIIIWLWQPWAEDAATSGQTGPSLVNVKVPELSGDAVAGHMLFERNCMRCHGKHAAGVDGAGPPLVHRIYEPNHHGDFAFVRAAKLGVRGHHWRFGDMPPVEGIREVEVRKIIVYVRQLQKANGIY